MSAETESKNMKKVIIIIWLSDLSLSLYIRNEIEIVDIKLCRFIDGLFCY